jgi:uncharacterized protein
MQQKTLKKWGIYMIPVFVLVLAFSIVNVPALAQQQATPTPTGEVDEVLTTPTPINDIGLTPTVIDETPDPLVTPTPGITTEPDPATQPTPTLTATPVIPETGPAQLQGVRIISEENIRSVSVTGSGQASAQPDNAVVIVGVHTQADEAATALTQNNEQMNNLINALTGEGIARENIQTRFVRLNPVYGDRTAPSPTNGPPQIIGYEATNTVQVRITDINQVGEILDLSIRSGGNIIENIRFEIVNRSALVQQARQAAIDDAQQKAEQLAQLTGTQLGMVISINESEVGDPRMAAVPEFADDAAVPIEPGTEDVRINLSITWQLTGGQ